MKRLPDEIFWIISPFVLLWKTIAEVPKNVAELCLNNTVVLV